MLSKKLNAALNSQMNKEFFAAYTYLSVAAYFEEQELGGFANFFKIQSQEELQHAMKIFSYLHAVSGNVTLEAIAAPKKEFKQPIDAFKFGLKNEQELAGDIEGLLQLAIAEHHAPTQVFLQWFITEQVEEEALFTRYIKRLGLVGSDPTGLLTLDTEFGNRTIDAGDKD